MEGLAGPWGNPQSFCAAAQTREAPQFFFSTSFCTFLPSSIKRRQTFSRNEITLLTSASLGSLSSGAWGSSLILLAIERHDELATRHSITSSYPPFAER